MKDHKVTSVSKNIHRGEIGWTELKFKVLRHLRKLGNKCGE